MPHTNHFNLFCHFQTMWWYSNELFPSLRKFHFRFLLRIIVTKKELFRFKPDKKWLYCGEENSASHTQYTLPFFKALHWECYSLLFNESNGPTQNNGYQERTLQIQTWQDMVVLWWRRLNQSHFYTTLFQSTSPRMLCICSTSPTVVIFSKNKGNIIWPF